MFVVRKSSKQMAICRRQREQPYTWVINVVHRQLPTVYQCQNEVIFYYKIKMIVIYNKTLGS